MSVISALVVLLLVVGIGVGVGCAVYRRPALRVPVGVAIAAAGSFGKLVLEVVQAITL